MKLPKIGNHTKYFVEKFDGVYDAEKKLQLTKAIAVSLGICCCVRRWLLLIKERKFDESTKAANAQPSVAKMRWRINNSSSR